MQAVGELLAGLAQVARLMLCILPCPLSVPNLLLLRLQFLRLLFAPVKVPVLLWLPLLMYTPTTPVRTRLLRGRLPRTRCLCYRSRIDRPAVRLDAAVVGPPLLHAWWQICSMLRARLLRLANAHSMLEGGLNSCIFVVC